MSPSALPPAGRPASRASARGQGLGLAVYLAISLAMAWYGRRANRRLRSELIAMDARGWLMSAAITAALLVAFVIGLAIQGTSLEWISPYVDPAVLALVCLAIFPIPTGRRAWIEDVIVEETLNGRGVGRRLTEAMLAHAKAQGCVSVDLTSRPSREAANHLYQRVGFELRHTNVYRFNLET